MNRSLAILGLLGALVPFTASAQQTPLFPIPLSPNSVVGRGNVVGTGDAYNLTFQELSADLYLLSLVPPYNYGTLPTKATPSGSDLVAILDQSTGLLKQTTVTALGSIVAVLPVASGGTNCSAASGTCLDNITGFSSTGFMSRTGAGAYSFTASSGSGNVVLTSSPTLTSPTLTSPSMTTPSLGVATGTSLALGGISIGSNALGVSGTSALSGATTVTSAASAAVAVGPNGTSNPVFQIDASTSSQAAGLKLTGAATAGTVALVATDSGSNTNLLLNARGSGALSLASTSTGGIALGNATGGSISVNNLLDASAATAGQIKFPSSQNASANPNTLDDYKEGTFVPVLSFGGASVGITYSTQSGQYTKIGNVVHYSLDIILSSKGSSTGTAVISGLPVASVANSGSGILTASLAAGATGQIQAEVNSGATTIGLGKYAAGTFTNLADTDFAATSVFRIAGVYFTN